MVVLFVQHGWEVGGVSFTSGPLPEWELPQKAAGCCVAVLKKNTFALQLLERALLEKRRGLSTPIHLAGNKSLCLS